MKKYLKGVREGFMNMPVPERVVCLLVLAIFVIGGFFVFL